LHYKHCGYIIGDHRPQASTKLYCLVTESHRCEELAEGCYTTVSGPQICTIFIIIIILLTMFMVLSS